MTSSNDAVMVENIRHLMYSIHAVSEDNMFHVISS
jgi:hypothetical protein